MLFRGKPTERLVLLTYSVILLNALLASCGNQDPAFTEISSTKNNEPLNGEESIVANQQEIGGMDARVKDSQEEPSKPDENTDKNIDQNMSDQNTAGTSETDATGSSDDKPGSQENNGADNTNMPPSNYQLVTIEKTQNNDNKKVDILWIIDSSGSMEEEQDYLGQKFDSFISALANSNTDFQTAITSTDICNETIPSDLTKIVCPVDYNGDGFHLRGDFVGEAGRKVLSKYDSDLVEKFNAYTKVGISGSGFEHGLKAAELAVKKVLTHENEGLVRNDSFLSVIVVSDEEDDGIGLGMKDMYHGRNFVEEGLTQFRYTHEDLKNYLTETLGAGKFSISAITGTRNNDGSMCSSPHSSPAEEGTQYIAAANATGGIIQSICATDWDSSLYNMGMDINAQISQITLTLKPYVPSIKVYVNGKAVSGWQYIEGTNLIKFNADAIPEDGSMIKVEYYGQPK
ncbi:MAG: hypothetical protein R3B45_07925 [Bdellovibrionota bacterium]